MVIIMLFDWIKAKNGSRDSRCSIGHLNAQNALPSITDFL